MTLSEASHGGDIGLSKPRRTLLMPQNLKASWEGSLLAGGRLLVFGVF
jgi:hypothetical protein